MHPSSSSPQWLCGDMPAMDGLYKYYPPNFVLVEHSVCHEPIFVLINVIMLLA